MKTKKVKTKKVKIEFEIEVPAGTKYIAMDENGDWWPFKKKPRIDLEEADDIWIGCMSLDSSPFQVPPKWEDSLIKISGVKR